MGWGSSPHLLPGSPHLWESPGWTPPAVAGSPAVQGEAVSVPSTLAKEPAPAGQSRGQRCYLGAVGGPCQHLALIWPISTAGGYLAHSLAIMTDAAHLLADMGSMSVSLFSLWVSARPPTKTMTFGWHRSEMLGALASVLSIWVVTGVLVYLASARIISNDYEINARAMLVTSACAVGVNIIMAYILHQSVTGHGHTQGYEKMKESPGCCAVRAAFVHVVGDLLQSLGVLTAATVIYMEPQYKIADPVSTFLFSVFVLGSTVSILRDVFRVLMEGAPRGVEFSAVKDVLLAVKDVKDAHNLHLWTLTLSHHMVSVHVAVGAGADMEDVLQEATAQLQSTFGFISCTVQVERYLEDMAACRQCQDPQD
uniref:Probable proton-coupled zinc antiporter SLC30A3 n=1 Tax=Chelonoidis abingdonii TaxID=106734 RepID=A0A8C0HC36_CHEAB